MYGLKSVMALCWQLEADLTVAQSNASSSLVRAAVIRLGDDRTLRLINVMDLIAVIRTDSLIGESGRLLIYSI